jgi:hypothetical protein
MPQPFDIIGEFRLKLVLQTVSQVARRIKFFEKQLSIIYFALKYHGGSLGSLPQEIVAYGAERALLADDALLKDYRTETYTAIIAEQVLDKKP